MKIELNKNPFKVPEGYMKDLTSEVMSRLPEKPVEEVKSVSLMDRMRPWIYMAAMFAGLGLFFNYFLAGSSESSDENDSLYVQNYSEMQADEDEDYLDFIESQYEGVLLAEEWKYFD